MAYGTVKVDNITFDNGGSDQNVTVSGLYRATTSGVTLSGTIAATTVSGVTVIGSTTVSGATVTGTTANFTSGNFSNIISSAATMSGALIMANQQQVRFREAVGNGVNHIALQAPAIVSADQTITLPDQTGTVITTGDNGSVSSTMLATNLTISAAAGSASTPSIAFTGDPNTGIYSPGADQVAVSTGGTGRLFVDASGNVGIGAPNPSALLDLRGSTSTRINFGVTGAASRAFLDYTESGFLTTLDADGDIRFSPNNTEAVRITTAGRVGIGTSSPTENLTIYGIGSRLAVTGDSSGSAILLGNQNSGGVNNPAVIFAANGELYFGGGSSWSGGGTLDYNMFISDSGNVGIGTTTPGVKVAINDPGTGLGFTNAASGNFNIGLLGGVASAEAYIYQRANAPLTFGTNNTERMRIDSSGRVGIGTSSPGEKLHILTSSNKDVRIANASHNTLTTGLSSAITFSRASDGTADLSALFGWNNGGVVLAAREEIVFANGGSTTYSATAERLRIDSSGRLLVGTSSARSNFFNSTFSAQIQVEGSDSSNTAISQVRFLNDASGPYHILAKTRSASSGGTTIVNNDDVLGVISFQGADGSEFVEAANITCRVDNTPGANDMPGSLRFSTTADGAASPTERLRIDSSGRVGIGTSSPSQLLTLNGNLFVGSSFNGQAIGDASAERIRIGYKDGAPDTGLVPAQIITDASILSIAARDTAASAIRFHTGTGVTERFRIDNAGQVLIGTTTFGSAGTSFSPIGAQVLYNNNTADTGVSLWCLSARPADTGRQFLYFQANTAVSPTVVFQVLNNGNTQNANGSFTSISDARLKENIVDSNSQWNDIKAIKIRNWNFKAETGLETHQQIGPVAQELELVCPGLVFEIFDRDADGNNLETATKGVNQSVLYMKAIKALQEAIARIETLEAAVAALQSA